MFAFIGVPALLLVGVIVASAVANHSDPTSDYWYCWDMGSEGYSLSGGFAPHHLGNRVSGDHLCKSSELREAGWVEGNDRRWSPP